MNFDIKMVSLASFRYISYEVISREPEEDAITHVENQAKQLKIENPYIIGWDIQNIDAEIVSQNKQDYITITLQENVTRQFFPATNMSTSMIKASNLWIFILQSSKNWPEI